MKFSIHATAMLMIAVSAIIFIVYLNKAYTGKKTNYVYNKKRKEKGGVLPFFLLLVGAVVIRLFLLNRYEGHKTDLNCFFGWANLIYENGFTEFYELDAFTDYPPGYMYFLYIIEAIRRLLGISASSYGGMLLIKLPAMTCDIITGYMLYYIGKKYQKEKIGLIAMAVYLYNPAILINSTIWGQVDAVFTLAVVMMCYFLSEKKRLFAYLAFVIGVLIKPQTLIFGPILLYGFLLQVVFPYYDKEQKKFQTKLFFQKFQKELLLWIAAIIVFLSLAVPYGLDHVFSQYFGTITSYPYASVNAYNLWTLFGLDWASQTGTFLFLSYQMWGNLFIVLSIAISAYLCFRYQDRKEIYYYIGAFFVCSIFFFSVRMHERYMFPALALLLMAFVRASKKEYYISYVFLSVVHFYNVVDVLVYYDHTNFDPKRSQLLWISFLGIVVYAAFVWLTIIKKKEGTMLSHFAAQDKGEKEKKASKESKAVLEQSDAGVCFELKDGILLAIIMLVYTCIAFYDLGQRKAPQTQWESTETEKELIFDLGEQQHISGISYFLGHYENRKFQVLAAKEEGEYETILDELTMKSVFAWGTTELDFSARYIKLVSLDFECVIRELVLLDEQSQPILPLNSNQYAALFDEQQMYPSRSTFREGTYFDEIYHARTAYEYMIGVRSYENTHPPFGKVLISLGMRLFGINPFGWRFMGTLFGIFMIPIIYLFGKRMLKQRFMAAIVTILFTFDFMHFTQSRIATIDVFVTFFILLMYYFMYQYTQMSFYDTPLKKTFLPLGLSGIAMGFGVASKWTGAYAGVGLAVLFFWTLYKRYREYRLVMRNKKAYADFVDTVKEFPSYTKKTIGFCMIFFVAIPIMIYVLSYLPFVNKEGMGLVERMLQNQIDMFQYHSNLVSTHPYSSHWYQWPIMYRPIWYYSGYLSDTVAEGISAFGNPLVWWAGIPAFFYMIYLAIKQKDKRAGFLIIGYLAQYLPWIFVTRTTYIYHYFTSVPFVALMVAYSFYQIIQRKPKLKTGVIVYTVLAVALFIVFYPVLSGQPINREFVHEWLRWMDSWVLVG